ncbi:MAG: metallophosphoesterase [Anaerolineae bacterium]|nr:metallophosphoesterase [Anaerolineae bacterium]
MRIAAIADLHCRANSAGTIRPLLEDVEHEADLLILAGDLTDTGLPDEIKILEEELQGLSLPIVAVLGNHDHESDQASALTEMLCNNEIIVLDGTVVEIEGVGFVGTKGFCGGFDNLAIQPFGERALKKFIETSFDEAVRLENALAKLSCPHKVAVLHYAPVKETLLGEPPELHPFLGSSRLANALDRQGVDLIVHGHAHHGAPQGQTPGGIPVYNVCRFVQSRVGPRAYRIVEV